VLVVEDSRRVTDRIREMLDQIPEVETVGAGGVGKRGRQLVAQTAPDVLILDLHLKEGTAFGVPPSDAAEPAAPGDRGAHELRTAAISHAGPALGVQYFLDKSREYDRLPDILGGHRCQPHGIRSTASRYERLARASRAPGADVSGAMHDGLDNAASGIAMSTRVPR
jgi:hypothetical protein